MLGTAVAGLTSGLTKDAGLLAVCSMKCACNGNVSQVTLSLQQPRIAAMAANFCPQPCVKGLYALWTQ